MTPLIVQLLAALLIAWIAATVAIGTWSIWRSARDNRLGEELDNIHGCYDRLLEGQAALVEYLVTVPHDTEELYQLSADVIRYAETTDAAPWLAETLLGFELEELFIDELRERGDGS